MEGSKRRMGEDSSSESPRDAKKVKREEAPKKDVTSVLEKAKKALEKQNELKKKLESLKKAKLSANGSKDGKTKKEQLELVRPEDLYEQGDSFYDPFLGSKHRLQRKSRPTLHFIEQGSLKKQAEDERLKAEFGEEYVQRLERREQGIAEGAEDVEIPSDSEGSGVVPDVEWWDQKILVDKTKYPDAAAWEDLLEESLRLDKLTHYIEHPIELDPVIHDIIPDPVPLKLTKKEMKKLRTQRRQAREAEKQELIRQGLLEPPKPKVKISNLMRVLGQESTADPTAIELEVSRQMAERQAAHDDRNLARMLTPAERREKKLKKLLDFTPGTDMSNQEIKVAVYRVQDLSKPQHRFKVQANARENHMSGAAISVLGSFAVVIVEGGPKTLRRYEKLMLHRIRWNEGEEEGAESNYCDLVWSGIVASKAFKGKFKMIDVGSKLAGRKLLEDLGVAHYWDLAAAYSREKYQ